MKSHEGAAMPKGLDGLSELVENAGFVEFPWNLLSEGAINDVRAQNRLLPLSISTYHALRAQRQAGGTVFFFR